MIIKFDEDKLSSLAQVGGELVITKDAETAILALLELKEKVEHALEVVKNKIKEDGMAIDPSFKGVVGEHVKATYRTFGEKYTYNRSQEDNLMPFLKETKYYKVDSTKVDEYVKETKEMPEGIIEKERVPQISLQVIETKNEITA